MQFFAFLKNFVYRQQRCQKYPKLHRSVKMSENAVLYIPGQQQAMSLCKKNYALAHICVLLQSCEYQHCWFWLPITHACQQTEHIIHMQMMSLCSEICRFVIYTEIITVAFSKTYTFKPFFKSLCFQACKTLLSCK